MFFKSLGLAVGGLSAAALAVYAAGGIYFQSHFYPGTTVNGVNASGASVDAVEEQISNVAKDYSLTLVEDGGRTEVISQEDVGLVIDAGDGQINSFMESQNGWGWINALAAPVDYNSKGIVTYDKKKLKKTVKRLGCVNNKNAVKTEDASPVYDGNKFVAVPEVYGTEIDVNRFAKKLDNALINLKESVDLSEEGYYNQPNVKADSEEMQGLLSKMNQIVDTKIVYHVGEAREEVNRDTIASWLTSPDGRTLAFNEETMRAFIDQMAAKYDTFGQPKRLRATSGQLVLVPGGSYGWKIDKDSELTQLQRELVEGGPIKRDFVYQYTAHTHDGPDYGNSYVEVNITQQHVYMYTNGQLVCDGPCVSGDVSKGNITHRGAYQMTYKERKAILRGQGYDVPVDYWMPFNGNEGLHDAQWRRGFGGSIYMTNGSHGCVNLPLSTAAGIFGEVDKGFPVLVYSSADVIPDDGDTAQLTAHNDQTEQPEAEEKEEEQAEEEQTEETEVSEESEETEEPSAPSASEQAEAVVGKINGIGQVSAESGAAISDARTAYNALSDEAKALVSNADTLSAAESTYGEIESRVEQLDWQTKANEVAGMITGIGVVTPESGPAIDAAEEALASLPDESRAMVANAAELAGKRAEFNALTAQ